MKVDWKYVHLWWGRIKPFVTKNPHVVFAGALIAAGGAVLSGQSLLLLIASHLFGANEQDWGWAPPAFAFACLILAPVIFMRGVPAKPVQHDDSFGFAIQHGWSFETAARAIAYSAEKVVSFENFAENDLAIPLCATEFSCATYLQAIEDLHHFAAEPGLPSYIVQERNGQVKIVRH